MKRWKLILITAVCVCLTVFATPVTAYAMDNNTSVVRYADGSYSIISITYDDEQAGISLTAGESTRRVTKREDHYSYNGDLAWTFTLYGEFTYDGRKAEATDADYSYKIYNSSWSFVTGSASYSGATARATGKFSLYGVTDTATVSLTCSANGVLS